MYDRRTGANLVTRKQKPKNDNIRENKFEARDKRISHKKKTSTDVGQVRSAVFLSRIFSQQ
jgi:hypothetical protein